MIRCALLIFGLTAAIGCFAGAAPVFGGFGGTLNYTENDAATLLLSAATVTDADSVSFDTGSLLVTFSAGGTASDELSIRNAGTGAGQIGVSGASVSFGGTAIGTFTGGSGGTPLVVVFNGNATPAAVQELLRNLRYFNFSNNPSGGARTVTAVLSDGSGAASAPGTVTVNVSAVNDPPQAFNAALTVIEDQSATGALPGADADNTALTYSIVAAPAKGGVEITNAANGSFRFTPQADATGVDSFTFKLNDGSANSNVATVSVNIANSNDAPVIVSAASAAPNPARPGGEVAFSVGVSDAEDTGVMIVWQFGDGTTASGASVAKSFAAPGVYAAVVTATDSLGASASSAVTVRVSPLNQSGSDPSVVDLDGDGFSDALETAAGTAVNDPLQTPTGSAAGTPLPLADATVAIKLNFARANRDRVTLTGRVLVPENFNATDQVAVVDVGGAARSFVLNPELVGTTLDSSFKVAYRSFAASAGAAKFTALLGGDFSDALAVQGLFNATTKREIALPVSVVFGGRLYTASVTVNYAARESRSGAARTKSSRR